MRKITLTREEQGKYEGVLKNMVDAANRDIARLENLRQHVEELEAVRAWIAKGAVSGPELTTLEGIIRRLPAGQVETTLKKIWEAEKEA